MRPTDSMNPDFNRFYTQQETTMIHKMHARNKALIKQLAADGFRRMKHLERTASELVYQHGTARVWFEDFEADYLTVMKIWPSTGVPAWKVTLQSATDAVVTTAILSAEEL